MRGRNNEEQAATESQEEIDAKAKADEIAAAEAKQAELEAEGALEEDEGEAIRYEQDVSPATSPAPSITQGPVAVEPPETPFTQLGVAARSSNPLGKNGDRQRSREAEPVEVEETEDEG